MVKWGWTDNLLGSNTFPWCLSDLPLSGCSFEKNLYYFIFNLLGFKYIGSGLTNLLKVYGIFLKEQTCVFAVKQMIFSLFFNSLDVAVRNSLV